MGNAAPVTLPHKGVVFEATGVDLSTRRSLLAMLDGGVREGYLAVGRGRATDYLLLYQGRPHLAARRVEERFEPLPLERFFAELNRTDAEWVRLCRTDGGLLLMLGVYMQHEPTVRVPTKLTDPERVLSDVATRGEDAAIVITHGAARHFAFCHLGKPVAAYFAGREAGASGDSLGDELVVAALESANDERSEMRVYGDLHLRRDEHAGAPLSAFLDGQLGPKPILLHIRRGSERLASRQFASQEIKIGREPVNDIVLDHLSVSRLHCTIRWEKGGYVIADRGSANRTRVNGHEIDSVKLELGDIVNVGEFEMRVAQPGDSDVRIELRTMFVVDNTAKARARLVYNGRTIPLEATVFTIGKSLQSSLPIKGFWIKPITATIVREADSVFRLLPVASRRTVLVDDGRIGPEGKVLQSGSVIRVGSHRFVFLMEG